MSGGGEEGLGGAVMMFGVGFGRERGGIVVEVVVDVVGIGSCGLETVDVEWGGSIWMEAGFGSLGCLR